MKMFVTLMVKNSSAYIEHKNDKITLAKLCELCSAEAIGEDGGNLPETEMTKQLSAFDFDVRILDTAEKSSGKRKPIEKSLPSVVDNLNLPKPSSTGPRQEDVRQSVSYSQNIEDQQAVGIAYRDQIEKVQQYLDNDLSVLLEGDKILFTSFLNMLTPKKKLVRAKEIADISPDTPLPEATIGYIHSHAGENNWILVLDRLDVWSHTGGNALNDVGRELIEVLYQYPNILVIGCVDRDLCISNVLQKRFDMRVTLQSISPNCLSSLVTENEVKRFENFDERKLYKNVVGLNAIRLRHALRYVEHSTEIRCDEDIYRLIRKFKTEMIQDIDIPNIKLDDIGGYGELKENVRQLISETDCEKFDEEFPDLIPRGILFHGPPGTGKTMFSKAIANEMNAVIEIVNGPEIISKWVGESERNLREIFERARNNAPAVVVFDEIDAIAASRQGQSGDSASRAANALVNQLLTEMDGFKKAVKVLIIGTTNRPGLVDEALKRPSRFRLIEIPLPDSQARKAIILKYLQKYKYHESHSGVWQEWAGIIAAETSTFSGDELHTVVKEVKRREITIAAREKMAKESVIDPFVVSIEDFGKEVGKLLKSKIQAQREHLGAVRRR